MAVTLGKSPVILTAVADTITGNWKVTVIRCITAGAAGEFSLFDRAGGREILHTRALQANDSEESGAIDHWIDGLYVQDMPAGGEVHVYYE